MIGWDRRAPRAVLYAERLATPDWDPPSRLVGDLVRMLRAADWQVTFVTSGDVRGVREVTLLRRQGVAVFSDDEPQDDFLAAAPFDLAIFLGSGTAARHLPLIRRLAPLTASIVALLPAESGAVEGDPPGSDVLETADAVLVASNQDADAIRERFPAARLHVLPDVGILQESPRPFAEREGALIVGALWDRWSALRAALPPAIVADHRLYVASVEEMPGSLGKVPSLRPYLAATRVVAVIGSRSPASAPLAIHALMFGTPIVTTSETARTLRLESGPAAGVLVEDDLPGLADRIAELLTDEHRWSSAAVAARSRIVEDHGREAAQRALVDLLDALEDRVVAA